MNPPTPQEAREALDSLDDYARMDLGVDAYGPRGVLERFIDAHSAELAAAQPALANENDWTEVDLWAEIHRLRAAVQGPDGYATWQDAATDERIKRVKAERAAQPAQAEPSAEDRAEAFIQAAISNAPDPLRKLGEFLTRVLDEDQWPTAERFLLAIAAQSTRLTDMNI